MVAGNQQAGKAGSCSGLPPKRIRDYAVWEFSSSTIHDMFSSLLEKELLAPVGNNLRYRFFN